jgi:hypothetical protein
MTHNRSRQPPLAVVVDGRRDRAEEVLGEELGATHDEEDETERETERTEQSTELVAQLWDGERFDHPHGCDPEHDGDAGHECSGGLLEHRHRQATTTLAFGAFVDLHRVGRRRHGRAVTVAVGAQSPARPRRRPSGSSHVRCSR